jgi:DNA-binding HxlR family transcriptional regulator
MQVLYYVDMKRTAGKSHCPLNFTLESVGDSWGLLILRDILIFKKRRYKEFAESEEKISTNILADRLKLLEKNGIIEKMYEQYLPTEKGIALTPIIIEFVLWGAAHDPKTSAPKHLKRLAKTNPTQFRKTMQEFIAQNN